MFATALKDLAVELNVSIMTSTQVNANVDDNKNIRNESSLAGGRATINKADNGAIMSRPTRDELDLLKPFITKFGEPNLVTDIYKVRSGRWTQLRIWSRASLGTLKKEDLFVTNSQLDMIEDFEANVYEIVDWTGETTEEIQKLLDSFNDWSK